eukprot:COSAG06_NODE_7579_length_2453_cov_1.578590_1_plen_133_part_00
MFTKTGSGQTYVGKRAQNLFRWTFLKEDTQAELHSPEASACFRRCEKCLFLSHLYIKTTILPRQARDKRRENSKKVPFSLRSSAREQFEAALEQNDFRLGRCHNGVGCEKRHWFLSALSLCLSRACLGKMIV